MPSFKSTYNIFKKPDEDEVFDPNWMDSDKLVLPPKADWDYQREMQIEDVDIWEVINEASGGFGVYAAWSPFAEFYLVRLGWDLEKQGMGVETYYGVNASQNCYLKAKSIGIPLELQQVWVDDDSMWLYDSSTKQLDSTLDPLYTRQ